MNFSHVSFELFNLNLFGFFVAFAFGLFAWRWYVMIGKSKLSTDYFVHYFWRWVLVGIVMARLFEFIFTFKPNEFFILTDLMEFWNGGFSIYGFLIGFLVTMWYDFKKTDFDFLRWLDLSIFPVLKALIVIDIGIFVTGAFYGTATGSVFGVKYETIAVDIISTIHPVSIYALIVHIFLFFVLRYHYHRLKKRHGVLFLFMLFVLILTAFLLRFITNNAQYLDFGFLDIVQVAQIFLLVLVFGTIRRISKRLFDF